MSDFAARLSQRTAWTKDFAAPVRAFLRTEAGSSGVLAGAIVLALLWANIAPDSYESFWHLEFGLRLGGDELSLGLREWINSGLMTLFFLVVGLEARREFDLGDLRERSRFVLPVAAGVAGMVLPVLHLPGLQPRWRRCARLGRRDVDRHRARARPARAGRPRRTGPCRGCSC